MKRETSQSPWKESTEQKTEIDMGQFCSKWVDNYERWHFLLENLDSGEGLTPDKLQELFAATLCEGVEEIERVKRNAEQTPEERERFLLLGCSLNFPRGWRTPQKPWKGGPAFTAEDWD